jgi:ubiquinone/menaquinone biosynthesis C-methylase UbiE
MLEVARRKATDAGGSIEFRQGDAASPPFDPSSFDVVLVRHVTWALSDPERAVRRWTSLLVVVECWS